MYESSREKERLLLLSKVSRCWLKYIVEIVRRSLFRDNIATWKQHQEKAMNDTSCSFEQELIYESEVQIIFCICYAFIGIGGIAGNIIMIVSTLR